MEKEIVRTNIMEQRKELMISPTGDLPTLRNARFLKPSVTSIDGPSLKVPALTQIPIWPVDVTFNGWRCPLKGWDFWLERMHSRYGSLWKETGIYDALMCSKINIIRDNDLIFGLVERWCSETNTFIFPWGESTLSLEDVLVLGGFSVLGDFCLMPFPDEKLIVIENNLLNSLTDLENGSSDDSYTRWVDMFMDKGSEMEHEAFLFVWLSRFVFGVDGRFVCSVFRMATNLARGIRLALAPAVLASIYRDLGLLKETMNASKVDKSHTRSITLRSPLSLVQIWAWERLPPLQPNPSFLHSGMVRMARWDGLENQGIGNVRAAIISAGWSFLWRPYTISLDSWLFPEFYKDGEMWLRGNSVKEDLKSFFRCLRPCHIVGLDCIEPYNPHRVAMQFGFDQDLPGWVPRMHIDPYIAWCSYNRPLIEDEILYAPARMFESDVTTQYLDWWRRTVTCLVSPFKSMGKGCRSVRRPLQGSWKKLEFGSQNPNVPQRQKERRYVASKVDRKKRVAVNEAMEEVLLQKKANDPEAPPGFPPKSRMKTTGQSSGAHNENGISSSTESVEKIDVQTGSKANKCKSLNKFLGSPSKRNQKKGKSKLIGAEPSPIRKRINKTDEILNGSRATNIGSLNAKKLPIASISGVTYLAEVRKHTAYANINTGLSRVELLETEERQRDESA